MTHAKPPGRNSARIQALQPSTVLPTMFLIVKQASQADQYSENGDPTCPRDSNKCMGIVRVK